jgi:hypothetical protein
MTAAWYTSHSQIFIFGRDESFLVCEQKKPQTDLTAD